MQVFKWSRAVCNVHQTIMTLEAHVPASCMVGFGFSLEKSATLKFDCTKDVDKQHDLGHVGLMTLYFLKYKSGLSRMLPFHQENLPPLKTTLAPSLSIVLGVLWVYLLAEWHLHQGPQNVPLEAGVYSKWKFSKNSRHHLDRNWTLQVK